MRAGRTVAVLGVVALLVTAAGCGDDSDDAADVSDGSVVTGSASPPDLDADGGGWPLPNHDHWSTRATSDSRIDSGTVGDLVELWRYEIASSGFFGASSSTPVVVGDTVFLGDLDTNVHAVDVTTGELRWRAEGPAGIFGPGGVAVGDGRVFAVHGNDAVAARSAETGELVWVADLAGEGGAVNLQPTVVDGLVLAATSALSMSGSRGVLFALDAATGDVVWSFDTVDSEDLWGEPEVNSGGGSWLTPAVDPVAGVSYWGTSNPYPFPGTEGWPNATSRPGDNRWTNSTLAIDLATGELLWGHQAVPHDLFDSDAVVTALADTDGDATPDVVVGTGKHARVIGMDLDGGVLWDTPIGAHLNDDLTAITEPVEVMPGTFGGVGSPIAVADGVVYVATVNAPSRYAGPERIPGRPQLGTMDGQLVALDATTGEILWDVAVPGDAFGGATVANDLVFTSVLSGTILAYDRTTGEEVWRHDAGGEINGWPAILDDRLVIPVGRSEPPALVALGLPDGDG